MSDDYVWVLSVCGPFRVDHPVVSVWSSAEKANEALNHSREEFKIELRHLVSFSIEKRFIDHQEPM